jgi:hypothetical protein
VVVGQPAAAPLARELLPPRDLVLVLELAQRVPVDRLHRHRLLLARGVPNAQLQLADPRGRVERKQAVEVGAGLELAGADRENDVPLPARPALSAGTVRLDPDDP